jgi:type VI protein secretion system component VasF
MPKKNKGLAHEIMDRIYVVSTNLDDHILNHPWIKGKKDLKKKVVKAQSLLMDVYQAAGQDI